MDDRAGGPEQAAARVGGVGGDGKLIDLVVRHRDVEDIHVVGHVRPVEQALCQQAQSAESSGVRSAGLETQLGFLPHFLPCTGRGDHAHCRTKRWCSS